MLTKPWNLYIFRHSSLTEKSKMVTEAVLRKHAGWTMSSKMPQIYIHYFGNESAKSLLEAKGLASLQDKENDFASIKYRECPNCLEPNKEGSNFCTKCKMVLSYDSYSEVRNEDQQKIDKLENDVEILKDGMNKILLLVQQNPLLAHIKPEVLGKVS